MTMLPYLCSASRVKNRFGLPHVMLLSGEERSFQNAFSNKEKHETLVPLMQAMRAKQALYDSALLNGLGDPML